MFARSTTTIYLKVPYDERSSAKSLGARWDPSVKKWYAPTGRETQLISKYGDTTAEHLAQLAVQELARQLLPNDAAGGTPSKAFMDGIHAFPGYAFIDTGEQPVAFPSDRERGGGNYAFVDTGEDLPVCENETGETRDVSPQSSMSKKR